MTDYLTKAERREARHRKKHYGMVTSGRSVLTIQDILRRRAERAAAKRRRNGNGRGT